MKKFDISHIDKDLLQKIPMRHPFITFNKDHFPPGIILLTKRTVVPATQQATEKIDLFIIIIDQCFNVSTYPKC